MPILQYQKTDSQLSDTTSLDPEDWPTFRKIAHKVLDACLDRLESARKLPWREPDTRLTADKSLPENGIGVERVAQELIEDIMPYATGNTHPRFFGWVHGSGLASGLLAEMVAATMNSNCGGRDHGAIYVERNVIDWCRQIFRLPESAGGILTSGTSIATVQALSAARVKALGVNVRKQGENSDRPLVAYAAEGTHHCVEKALSLMGIGSDALRIIPVDEPDGSLRLDVLYRKLHSDRANGFVPLAIIGTAGSVNTGRFDDFNALAEFSQREDIWLHVDGAYGAWAVLADAPWSSLVNGLDRADSIAFDFHKWMYVQYDVGAVMLRDVRWLNAAFSGRPAYLESDTTGLAGGNPWYCENGIELSRSFRALKVWTAIKTHGLSAFGKSITKNCEQAAELGALVNAAPELELAAPVIANVCCFRVVYNDLKKADADARHRALAARLQIDGDAVLSTTTIDGGVVLRAAIVNHRTTMEDIRFTVEAVRNAILEL